MGVTNFPDGVNIGSEAGGTADFQLGGTVVDLTAAEFNALKSASLDATELGYLDTVVAGTLTASKALVVNASKKINTLDITTPVIGGGTLTASAAELNYNDGSGPGTAVASKTLVLGANKNADEFHTAALYLGSDAGTQVTATAAELNLIDGSGAGTAVASKAAVLGANKELDEFHTAALYLGAGAGTQITATAAEINALASTGLDATELGYLDGASAGTATASKAVVLDASSKIDTLDITTPVFNGSALLATSTELNVLAGAGLDATELGYLDGTSAGTATASKAVVLDATSKIDTLDIIAPVFNGSTLTATAAQLNAVMPYSVADKLIVSGTVTIPSGEAGTAFVPTGLTAAETFVFSPACALGSDFFAAKATVADGTVTALGYCLAGTASLADGTITYVSIGT